MSQDTCVCIVSRNAILREGLWSILTDQQFHVAATAADSAGLTAALAGKYQPDLIIIEAALDTDGIAICSQLREQFASARLVLLGDDDSISATSRAMAVGADGYLIKEMSGAPLVGALRLVVLGEKVMPSRTLETLSQTCWNRADAVGLVDTGAVKLSDREIEILGYLTHGDANKLISRQLAISEDTVKVHIRTILRKLSVLNRTQAAVWAVSHGVINQYARIDRAVPVNAMTTPARPRLDSLERRALPVRPSPAPWLRPNPPAGP